MPNQLEATVMRLLRAGWSASGIRVRCGLASLEEAERLIAKVLADSERTQLAEAASKQVELQRLDWLWKRAMIGAKAGEPAGVLAALKVCESRRRLLGLDAPKKSEVQLKDLDGLSDAELQAKAEELRARWKAIS